MKAAGGRCAARAGAVLPPLTTRETSLRGTACRQLRVSGGRGV